MAIQIRARRVMDEDDEYDRLEQYDRLVDLFDDTGRERDSDYEDDYEDEFGEEDE